MTQKEFLILLKSNKRMQSELQMSAENGGNRLLIFSLGVMFGGLGVNRWKSDRFITKICKICNIEW